MLEYCRVYSNVDYNKNKNNDKESISVATARLRKVTVAAYFRFTPYPTWGQT